MGPALHWPRTQYTTARIPGTGREADGGTHDERLSREHWSRMPKHIAATGIALAGALFAAGAQASYAQMRLDGAGLLLALVLSVLFCGLVDLLILVKLFRFRLPLAIATLIAAALATFFVAMALSPGERTGYFKGEPGGLALAALLVTAVVFVPFMLAAPAAQYRSLKEGRRWPAWVGAGLALQAVSLAAWVVMAVAG